MKALFLAGGKGVRLQPLTDKVPKPMVPIMNKPLLERTMINLKKNGISEIVISSCYQSDYIKEYFGDGEHFGLKIQYTVEDVPLGTGGAIKKGESRFKDTFIVFNSDILSDIDIQKMIDFHKSSHALATIAITEVQDPSAYGAIEYDISGYAVSFVEKPRPEQISSNFINAGIYIFEPEILKEIPVDSVVSIERETFPRLLSKGYKIAVYKSGSYWMDIGTLEKYMQAHNDIMDGKCKLVDCGFTGGNISMGKNVKIHPDSEITGPVYIGDNVSIGAKAIINNSVIGNNVSIGAGCRINGSILWNGVNISREVRLINTIVTANSFISLSERRFGSGNIAFLSTYPPRECGLATFTQDLTTAMDNIGIVDTNVIAVSNSSNDCYDYDGKVTNEIRQNERQDYIEIAKKLNNSDIDLLVIEHEFGIFGGNHGDYILDLVNNLEIPVVTTLHTILSEPDRKQKYIIKTLGEKSEKIITMARNTKQLLQSVYGVEPGKIEVIHHGVPKKLIQSRETLKKKYGYENMQIISTFGLIGPGKGIEYGIEAISKVACDNSDILYLILGQTHPCLLMEEGEAYRNKLVKLVSKLNLNNNVKFINKYLSKDEIIQYLQLSDIYLTPYPGKDQAVSGTLAYAVGYGRAIVSTPYLYAREMLSEGRGLLAEFNNSDSLSDCIKNILNSPIKKSRMERNTFTMGRTMYWDKIALHYSEVLSSIIKAAPKIGVV